jgi:hypothetical protein
LFKAKVETAARTTKFLGGRILSEMKKCPECGAEMEKGFVVSRLVAWSDKKISNWSLRGVFGGEQVINQGYPYPIANVEGYRCENCKLIVFKYGENEGANK